MDIPATLEGRSGHGVERRRGRSFFTRRSPDSQEARHALERAQAALYGLADIEVERFWTPLSEGAVHHVELGRGRPLVLLHGAGGGGANWYRVMGALAAERRVLAPDLPGFGFSDPVALRTPLGVRAAEHLEAWLDARAIQSCDIVGTSFGALAALRLAQGVRIRVGRLVLIDAVGLGAELPWVVRCACTPVGGPVLARSTSRAGTRFLLRRLLTSTRLPPEHEEALVRYLAASAQLDTTRHLERALRGFGALRGQTEILSDGELRALRIPTLLMWGERDRFVPASHAARAARNLPHATVHVIAGAGHSPNWERPDAVADALLEFLHDGTRA
jgi:pimeloyl-ACP methyl ester carboxylesterase